MWLWRLLQKAFDVVFRRKNKKKHLISLIVPRRRDHGYRDMVWEWLEDYWESELGSQCEIVIGHDWAIDQPFSKAVAVNDGAKRAKGDIFVILDADAYLPGEVIKHAATRIRRARKHDVPMWFIPYHYISRLTRDATEDLFESSPRNPKRFPSPPDPDDVQDNTGSGHGHRFGAMIQIMPREAFELVGGMDERFRGWGGEDVSFLRALDTLYVKHKNTPNDVLHLWHPKFHIGDEPENATESWRTRIWNGQDVARTNDWLSMQYDSATNKRRNMRALTQAGFPPPRVSPLKVWILRVRLRRLNRGK